MNDQADIGLIAACQQGDPRAFRDVFELYKDRIFALCRHMSGSSEDAEDLAQDVFIAAFRNIGAFRAEASFGTWLYRIAANRCTAELRKKPPAFRSFEAMDEVETAPPSNGPSPEDRMVRKELAGRLRAAIAALPENLRLIFVLGTVEGIRSSCASSRSGASSKRPISSPSCAGTRTTPLSDTNQPHQPEESQMPAKKKPTEPQKAVQPAPPGRVGGVDMDISLELGRVRIPIETILEWTEGSLIELNKVSGDPADVRVNGEPFGAGEVVTVGECFGIRLTEILDREDT